MHSPAKENITVLDISQFLIKWMGETPNYTFGFEQKFYKTIKSDIPLMARYLAAMSSYAIKNDHKKADKALQVASITEVLTYCTDEKNGVDLSKKLKKYVDAKNAGTLDDLIDD